MNINKIKYRKRNHNLTQLKLGMDGNKIKMKIPKEKLEFRDTIKADSFEEEVEATIEGFNMVSTEYGEKEVLSLDGNRQMFLNAFSLQNLVKEYGNETNDWDGKRIKIVAEKSERTRNKKSLIAEAIE